MDAARSPGSDRGCGYSEDAIHPGVHKIRDTERHIVRQHPRKDEEDDGPRGGGVELERGNGRARVLLRHQRQPVQSANEKIIERDPQLCRKVEAKT